MNPLILTGLTSTAWCAAHSAFVSRAWQDLLRRRFPRFAGLFRLVYVMASTVSLVAVGLLWRDLPSRLLWDWPGPWAAARWTGLALAVLLFGLGARAFDGRAFLGLRQAADTLAGRTPPPPVFKADGILAHIRHPWYSGSILVFVCAGPVTDVNLIWRTVFIFYTIIGTELEERKLLRDWPEAYADYRRDVGRYWPRRPR